MILAGILQILRYFYRHHFRKLCYSMMQCFQKESLIVIYLFLVPRLAELNEESVRDCKGVVRTGLFKLKM